MKTETSAILIAAITSTCAMISSFFNRKHLGKQDKQLTIIHETFNSRMDLMHKLIDEAAFARGMKAQRDEDEKKK